MQDYLRRRLEKGKPMNIFFRLWPVFAVLVSNTLIAAFLTEFTFLSPDYARKVLKKA